MTSLFMTLIFYSCILIMLVMNLNDAKPKKNIILGATIPVSHQNDARVTEIVKQYKKESIIAHVILTALLIPSVFVSMSANLFYSMTWLVFAMVGQQYPFIRANKALIQYKKEQGLRGETSKVVDLKLSAVDIKASSPWISMIPFVLSLGPIVYTVANPADGKLGTLLFAYITTSACILLCMVLHIFVARRAKDVVSNNTDINKALSVIRTRNWAKMFIGTNFILCILNYMMFADIAFSAFSANTMFIAIVVITVVLLGFAMYVEFDTRNKQYKYTTANPEFSSAILDEDDYWIWGMFYYNPNDNRFMIPDRVGSNTTVNMAKPAGKAMMGVSALLIAACPFIGAYFYYADQVPMTLEFTDTAIIATHMSEEYNIPLDEIVKQEKFDEVPEIISKINGYATDKVYKGTFSTKDYGVCEVFFSTDATEFYVVETEDETYILGE